jgi:hypothetical protein
MKAGADESSRKGFRSMNLYFTRQSFHPKYESLRLSAVLDRNGFCFPNKIQILCGHAGCAHTGHLRDLGTISTTWLSF